MFKDITILYVEDDQDIAEEIIYFLKKRVKALYTAVDGEEGIQQYKQYRPDLIITDIQMPRMNGLQMSASIRRIDTTIPIIVTSAYNDNHFLTEAIELGISGYIVKPVNLMNMMQTIEKVLEPMLLKKALETKNRELERINADLDAIVAQKTEELEYLYRHDSMTRLYNIVKLKEELELGRYDYLLLLDIRSFSILNKQFGKEFGDTLLVAVAGKLQQYVSKKISLFKVESDRFVLLLKDYDQQGVEHFCQSLIRSFATTDLLVDSHPISITFNIGVAAVEGVTYPLLNAEYALDMSKNNAHSFFCMYDSKKKQFQDAKETIKWLDITKEILHNGMIRPYFQPILDVTTHTIYKYEVLARGYYNDQVIAPNYFLGAAERLGLITEITRLVIDKSFDYFQHNDYEFSINITESDIVELYLKEYLQEKLHEYNIAPQRVTLEILESVTTTKLHQQILQNLLDIKKMGIKIAVDDFGIESSNFSRLIDIDFDYIKLDGLFIKNLDKYEKDRTIVRAIVQLAKTLGIKTVAEFVENETIAAIVTECGIDYIQGYYIGKAMPTLQNELNITC